MKTCPNCGHQIPEIRMGLTPQQRALLDAITRIQAETGVAPSYSEMAAAIGAKSKATVARLMQGLEDRGHIRRMPRRARSYGLVGTPS